MKRFLILAALAAAPIVAVGCTCQRSDQVVCPAVVQPNCPPAMTMAQPRQVVYRQVGCPTPAPAPVAVAQAPAPAQGQVYLVPAPAAGRITYAQPIQVGTANGVVQYYNPYLQPRVIQ